VDICSRPIAPGAKPALGEGDTMWRLTPHRTFSPLVRLGSAALVSLALAFAGTQTASSERVQPAHDHDANGRLVRLVRESTQPFLDINAAVALGYGAFLGCVSGPQEGAMGVHYVNGDYVADGELDPAQPEALMYEFTGGRARLLGVEFIVDAATWLARHDNQPPVLEGQVFHYVGSPNRYALPAFFELHVWAWRDNPNGTFVDWNPRVKCDQP
jgi:hypothetical protein